MSKATSSDDSSSSSSSSYKTTYSRGSALGRRRAIIPEEHRFRFRAYGFPKAPMNVPREQRGQMPTQADINRLVDQCAGVPVTTDHGAWEVIHRANGNSERVCKRAPSIVGQVTSAFIDEHGRLVLDCELETSFHGMSQAQQISSGDKRDVSLGLLTDMDPATGHTTFSLDHVALVPQGRAKGTHILEASCPAMPGLAFYGREFGMDPKRYPLTARLQQLIANQQRTNGCSTVHVGQSQKSSHAAVAKKSNGISLYSSSAEQCSIVGECHASSQQQQQVHPLGSSTTHCSPRVSSSTMTSVAPATPAVAPMDVAPTTPAATPATAAPVDAQSVAAAPAATNNNAAPTPVASNTTTPISADTLNSALTQATGATPSAATNTAAATTDASDVPSFVSKLLQNTEMPSDEKLLQMGEKMLEQTQMSLQVQQEMQELRQRLARFETEQDTKSRSQVEQQVQLLEQALATDPNNPAFSQNGITKESLEKFKQMTLKLAPEERDLLLKVNQSVAAFGMNSQITETYEAQSSAQGTLIQNQQDELARLRQQEQESRERAAVLERQQRQQQLAMRFANIQSIRMTMPMSSTSSIPAPSSSSSCAMSQLFQSARPMSAMSQSMPMSAAAGGSVSNFGSSPSVSQRMSEDTFVAAVSGNAKRAADTSSDASENPAKMGTGAPVMGRLSNDMAALNQKARVLYEKQQALKKSKKY